MPRGHNRKAPVDARIASARRAAGEAEREKERLQTGLPHLFGFKWYTWAKGFFDSTNSMNLLCAANQISKSSTQIRKYIHWATCVKEWPRIWPKKRPRMFWVLYPDRDVATIEWYEKIEPEFMPRGEFKNHPVYGWNVEFEKKQIKAIHFNSGVSVYFKSYSQDVHSLQSGTVDAIFCDEELPEELYDELKARLFASDGFFHMVFTATRGALMWLRAIEGKGDDELFPDAFKQQISMFDCMYYTDGTEGAYSKEKIKRIISECRNENEVLRRVYGRFIKESGRVCDQFDPLKHFVKPFKIPETWHYYSGIDNGGGGEGHPGSYWFLAVKPDYREAYLVDGWRGEDEVTTAGDIMQKWEMQRGGRRPVQTAYDWAAKDLNTMGERMGIPLVKAEKSHDIGWDILNTLFKFNILRVFDSVEGRKFGSEALTVMKETPKRRRKDDLLDAARYAACAVPWDWTVIQGLEAEETTREKEKARPWTPEDQAEDDLRQRRGETRRGEEAEEGWGELSEDIDFWNEEYG